MAEITDNGLVIRTEAQYRDLLIDVFRTALGQDMSTGSQTPQMQLVSGLAGLFSEVEQVLLWRDNGFNLDKATGSQLDDLAVLFGLVRKAGVRSTVSATLAGTAGTVISRGARVRSTGLDVFELTSSVTIGAGGTVMGSFQAVNVGEVAVGVGELNRIISIQQGWNTVTNGTAAVSGKAAESDSDFRVRIRAGQSRNATGNVAAVRSRLLDVDGVNDAHVIENNTGSQDTFGGVTVAANSFCAVVWGGAAADIAQAIYNTIRPGDVMSGNQSLAVTPVAAPLGAVTVRWQSVTEIEVDLAVAIRGTSAFPANGLAQIEQNIQDWWAGTWNVPGQSGLQSAGVGIGDLPTAQDIYRPVLVVPGAEVGKVTVSKASDDSEVKSVDLDEVLILDSVSLSYSVAT